MKPLSLQNGGFRNTYECIITVGVVFAVHCTTEVKGLSFVQKLSLKLKFFEIALFFSIKNRFYNKIK